MLGHVLQSYISFDMVFSWQDLRGNAKQAIFIDDEDRGRFIANTTMASEKQKLGRREMKCLAVPSVPRQSPGVMGILEMATSVD
jgi:hypothetical protein